jgi:hypothetical protein
MTQLNITGPTDPTGLPLTDLTRPSGLSGPGWANLSALTALDAADLPHPTNPSDVDEHGPDRPGASLGGLPGASLVRETPSEPPPEGHPTAHVNAHVRPTRDRGD